MKFTIIKSCLARFSGIFALGTPSNIHGTAISYRCAKFGAFVNSVTILTLRDLTNTANEVSRGDDRQVAMFLIILRGKNGSGHFIATIHETYSVRGTFRAILYQV